MPYLSVTTNAEISAETESAFLREASQAVATQTGKPEQYVMVRIEHGQAMFFAGQDAPAAFMEVKSIGFPAQGVGDLAAVLCELAEKRLGVPSNRMFVVFTDVKAAMWGHDGRTFG